MSSNGVELFPFQQRTVISVRTEFSDRAILADEVGLGKTIEAGAIIKEVCNERPFANILLVLPKALLGQWRAEILHKFNLLFHFVNEVPELKLEFDKHNLLWAMTHGKLARADNTDPVTSKEWDLVVVDEAHKFCNPETKRYEKLSGLKTKGILLLTATPVQNNIVDLYHLAELVKPRALSHNAKDFVETFAFDKEGRTVKRSRKKELRTLLAEVMARTTRSEAGVYFPPREVKTHVLDPNSEERTLLKSLYATVREMRDINKTDNTPLKALSMHLSISSHPLAFKETINSDNGSKEKQALLKSIPESIVSSKEQELYRLIVDEPEHVKWLVFVERLKTGEVISERLSDKGYKAKFYHGGLSNLERGKILNEFKKEGCDILLATSAGSEGLNLQHCHKLVNYDLHWNPLRIEQRIGRVHRMGQKDKVEIYNLAIRGTIDEIILRSIISKINLFEMTIGRMGSILGLADEELDLAGDISQIVYRANNSDELADGLEQLGNKLQELVRKEDELSRSQPL